LKKILLLFLIAWILTPLAAYGEEGSKRTNSATLVMEYGIDSLERRYYRPVFHFDFYLSETENHISNINLPRYNIFKKKMFHERVCKVTQK